MNSSPKQCSPVLELPREPVLVREAGLPYRPKPAADPFERWIALMEVVEALCPRWPERPPPTKGSVFRL